MIPFDFMLGALATFRLTRLVTDDLIFDRPRVWLARRSKFLDLLLDCAWCVSIWVGGLVVLGWWLLPHTPWVGATAFLSWSAISGLLASNLDR